MNAGLIGRDLYLRFGDGPVQCFRVWDGQRFINARMADGTKADPSFVVELCTQEEYMAERQR